MSSKDPTSPISPIEPPSPSSAFISPNSPTSRFAFVPQILTNLTQQASSTSNQEMRRRNSSTISMPSTPLDATMPLAQPQAFHPARGSKRIFPSPVSPLQIRSYAEFHSQSPLSQASQSSPPWPSTPQPAHSSLRHTSFSPTFTRSNSLCRNSVSSPPPSPSSPLFSRIISNPRFSSTSQTFSASGPTSSFTYRTAVSRLRTPLVPLVSVATGQPHPYFPRSLLQYHVLTHTRLDELARFYHQVTPPVRETDRYPTRIPAWTSADADASAHAAITSTDLETKRRRWGRFIGLRGCESPTTDTDTDTDTRMTTTEGEAAANGLVARMEREWARARERRDEEERMSGKSWRGRW